MILFLSSGRSHSIYLGQSPHCSECLQCYFGNSSNGYFGRSPREQKISQDDESKSKKTNDASGKHTKEEGSKITLSGLLKFIDGLWSASGGERIIVFTTNYPDKLDPALIRAGRMDNHIELSYCCFEGFKVLAKNYMMIETHPLFKRIRRLLEETKITPTDVAENLMPKSLGEEVEKRLEKLIQVLEEAKKEEILERTKKVMQKPEEQKQEPAEASVKDVPAESA